MKHKNDIYYLQIAKAVSLNVKCHSRKIGAILVNQETNSVIGTGYNGPPAETPHCDEPARFHTLKAAGLDKSIFMGEGICPRKSMDIPSGQGLEFCVAAHAERNAILNAAKNGHKTEGVTLYCYCGTPCKDCAIEIINAGIKRIVCLEQTKDYDNVAAVLLDQAGIVVDKYSREECEA